MLVHQTVVIRVFPGQELIKRHFPIRKGWEEKFCHNNEGFTGGVDFFDGFAEDDFGLAARVEVCSVKRLGKVYERISAYRGKLLTLIPRA